MLAVSAGFPSLCARQVAVRAGTQFLLAAPPRMNARLPQLADWLQATGRPPKHLHTCGDFLQDYLQSWARRAPPLQNTPHLDPVCLRSAFAPLRSLAFSNGGSAKEDQQ